MRYNFAKNVSQLVFLVVALVVSCSVKAAMDYNGNPINTNGGITITPQTSSAVLASYTQSINTDGLLDNTFGSLGTKTNLVPGSTDSAVQAVAIQPDGKMVVVGSAHIGANNVFAVIRYNIDGSIDTSFGPSGTGYVTTPLGTDDVFTGVVLQSDGKIVAGGYAQPVGLARHQFAVVRYNSNGILDTTFNAAGTNPGINLTTLVAGHDATANGITGW